MKGIILIVSAVILLGGCSSHKGTIIMPIPPNAWIPAVEGVNWVNLQLNRPPAPSWQGSGPLDIYPATARGRASISKLLDWLRHAKRLSGTETSPLPSFNDHSMTFSLTDGKSIAVAYDYVSVSPQQSSNEVGYHGPSSTDVLVTLPGADRSVVYRAPALVHWLEHGWKADFAALASSWSCASKHPLSPRQNEISGYLPNGKQWVVEADAAHGCVTFYRGNDGQWESSVIASQAFSSPRSGASVEQAQFVDASHGFVLVGGSVGAGQLPRILFSTRDGGTTWRSLPANSKQPFPGSDTIVTMRFTSPADGWLVTVNEFYGPHRLYVYQTTDGGMTWTDTYTALPGNYGTAPYQNASSPTFTDAEDGALVIFGVQNYPNLVCRTFDGGKHWTCAPAEVKPN